MSILREQQRFPTRSYPYGANSSAAPDAVAPVFPGNILQRRVVGLDVEPRAMTSEELRQLEDPFGRLLRSGKPFPLTTRELLAAIDALAGTPDALPSQLVFLVADAGHVRWTPQTDQLARGFRFAIARGAGDFRLLVSSSTVLDSPADAAFLQIIGWDGVHEVFHFYERRFGTYFWAGMSTHALEEETRGKGPFDSHVNGALVMKELRPPWLHWHSPQAGINADAFAPDDPLRTDPLFQARVSAERLESEVVRPGIRRWNQARVAKAIASDGTWRNVRWFMRQAVMETTVNLTTSDIASHVLTDTSQLRPPLSFFLNRDVLFDTLDLVPSDPDVADIIVPGRLYRECLKRYDVYRTDGTTRIEGDSHFAFLVPEAAFEDTDLVDVMLRTALVSERLLACLCMTDFPNPVFSSRRSALLGYMPDTAHGPNPGADFETRFVQAVRTAISDDREEANSADSPEREFLANWETADYKSAFARRIGDYFAALRSGMADAAVVDGWFRLVEFRRRRFRCRKLAEFKLTTPLTNIPLDAPALRMNIAGRAEQVPLLPKPASIPPTPV